MSAGAPGILFTDLDNTLIARTAALRAWAVDFVAEQGGDEADVEFVMTADGDGFRPKATVLADLVARFPVENDALLASMRAGLVDRLTLDPSVAESVGLARAAGWSVVVVTNGTLAQQERKLRRTGLDRLVDAWIVSEGAGVSKPNPRIFTLAAQLVGRTVGPRDWMVGDSAEADVGGGQAAGVRTAWLHRGRRWAAPPSHPDLTAHLVADSFTAAVHHILDGNGA